MAEYRLPSLAEFEQAEHCVLEDVTSSQTSLSENPAAAGLPAREISDEFVIRDTLRGFRTSVRLYTEGWVDIAVKRRGQLASHRRFNLSYLDSAPEHSRHYPKGLLKFAGVLALLTGICAGGWQLGFYPAYAPQAAIVGAAATLASLLVAFYRSHQQYVFVTLHGRASAMRLRAGLGAVHRLRRRLPRIVDAVAKASRASDDDTATYLRAEMREHYRLKNEGVLTEDECATSTGKILSEFEGPL